MTVVIATHSGKFHADDVFAVATLLLLKKGKEVSVVRTRDPELLKGADFVVDVGGVCDDTVNRFDHHQVDGAGERPNGIPYAAFGLVWKRYGTELTGSTEASLRLDEVLCTPLDASDNGIDLTVCAHPSGASVYELSDAIRSFTPAWDETSSPDQGFTEAVSLAGRVLEREIKRAQAFVAGRERVMKAYGDASDKRLIVLDGDYSWRDLLQKFPEPLFIVHPQDDVWRLYAVRDGGKGFKNRKDLPESWAGLRDEELAKVTGVSDAVFTHRNRFMAVARSMEGALQLARQALAS